MSVRHSERKTSTQTEVQLHSLQSRLSHRPSFGASYGGGVIGCCCWCSHYVGEGGGGGGAGG